MEKRGTRALTSVIRKKISPKSKRSQVTIFIIIAIMIVVLGILIYMFWPKISSSLGFGTENPSQFIQSCVEDEIEESAEKLSLQGGSIDPEHYLIYGGNRLEYLCYTGEYYVTCVMQQPMLKRHIEQEIKTNIKERSSECFKDMKKSFERRGYTVNLGKGDYNIELLPKRIAVKFDNSLSLVKAGETKKYDSMSISINNNLYELISIANSILNYEAHYGDSETTLYMNYYHDLKVEKIKLSDGSTVYILTDRNNGNKFQFASRSLAWPPGYV